MDLPQLLHHYSHNSSRYVSVSNSSRSQFPEDHPNFPNPRQSENPRFHHHQHQFHHNPPPPPPPPPPTQTPPFQPPPASPYKTPPPHAYNPGQSQFAFANPSNDRPFDDGDRSSSRPAFLRRGNFSPSAKVSQHRIMVDNGDDRRRVIQHWSPEFDREVRPEFWDQPRIPAENVQVRVLDFDPSVSQKFQIGHNKSVLPYNTSNRLRNDLESGSSRCRVEYGEFFERKHGDEPLHSRAGHEGHYRRGELVPGPGVSVRQVEFVPNLGSSLRNVAPKSEIRDGRYEEEMFRSSRRDGAVNENQRRVYDRKAYREVPSSSYERDGSLEIGSGDGTRFVSGKREYFSPGLERYSRVSRGESYQVNRTLRKQFQKKSALLRIQKPNYRNSQNEKFAYYHDDSNSSSFRRRDQYAYTNTENDEIVREGSPVQLNVSFKSNSLVAKAIVTPPSALGDTDADLTSLNAKLTEPCGSNVDVGISVEALDNASTFDREVIHSEEKVTSADDICDSNEQISLNLADMSHEKVVMQRSPKCGDLEKNGIDSSQLPRKVAKKKKVVKKIVKRVIRPRPRVLKSVQKKGPVIIEDADTHKGIASLSYPHPSEVNGLDTTEKAVEHRMTRESEEHYTHMGVVSLSYPHPSEVNGLRTTEKAVKLQMTRESEEHDTNLGTCSVQEEVNIDKVPEYVLDSSRGFCNISDGNEDLVNSHSVNLFPNVSHVVDPVQSRQIMLPAGDNMDNALPNSGHTKMLDRLPSVFHHVNITDSNRDTVNGTKLSDEKSLIQEEFPKPASRSSPATYLSSSMETIMDVHSSHNQENIISCTSSDVCRLPGIDVKETSLDRNISLRGNEDDISIICRKRMARSQLNFSRVTNDNLDASDVSNPASATDTAMSLSTENISCEAAVSSSRSLDDGLQPGQDCANVPQNSSSYATFEANLISGGDDDDDSSFYPLLDSKRRKVSVSHYVPENDEKTVDTSSFCLELPLTSNEASIEQQMEMTRSTTHSLCAVTDLMSCVRGITDLNDNKLAEGSSDGPRCFLNDEEEKEDGDVMAVNMQIQEEAEVGITGLEEIDTAHDVNLPCKIPSGIQSPNVVETFSCRGTMESDNLLLEKGDFPNFSNCSSPPTDRSEATSFDEAVEIVPDSQTRTGSPQTLLNVSDVTMSDATSVSQLLNEISMEEKNMSQKCGNDCGSDAKKSSLEGSKSLESGWKSESDQTVERNATSLALQDSRSSSQGLNVNQHVHRVLRAFPGYSSSQLATMKKRATLSNANARTWRRNASSSTAPLPRCNPLPRAVPSQRELPRRDGKFESTSYVRKGNSLVRNSSPPAALQQGSGSSPVYRLNSVGLDESKRSIESDNRVVIGSVPGHKPSTSLIQSGSKLPGSTSISPGSFMSSASTGPLSSGGNDSNADNANLSENNDIPKLIEAVSSLEDFENGSGQLNNSDSQTEPNEGNSASLNTKRIVYVKPKSNQLVATSNSVNLPVVGADKTQASSFDGYYTRRKNQLIRTSLESHAKKPMYMSDNSGLQMTPNPDSSFRLSKKRSLKAFAKTFKRATNSFVWTLRSTHPAKNSNVSLNNQKVFPHLFPWKRAAYWRSFMHNWSLFSKSVSSIAISGKLLRSRMRDTVYTRSRNGFSLRKSKVLSVGGSSLKWSKSIERDSKKANEEATLAVAAVERKKREQKGATRFTSGSKNRNHSSRERIFRIGVFRYKMDTSRRTLQRISDESSTSCAPSTTNSEKDAKSLYIPRRLVIGNNEYVRIGNGNQLIRDPKKRTRVLASEKVRWSLHTARLRLARKRKYCQFFTRFGRCNKDSGKCPYLHDPSKIAVCTKFLNDLCTNGNCKLTHKVIPERMPVCSYFLQGLCTNRSCPYRHVNVNPKASTCEGFLKGYCADGDECRKKHSYVCPTFEETGACPRGSKCKLHHPKSRIHGKKKKRSRESKNARGWRYFGSPDISLLEPKSVVSDPSSEQYNNNDIFSEGTCADYIAIGLSDDDTEENNDLGNNPSTIFCDSDTSSDLESEDFDELMKPIRLMVTSLAA